MAQKPRSADNVFSFGDDVEMAEEFPVGHKLMPDPVPTLSIGDVIDLTGKPKVLMAFGAGSSGKTTFLRWVVEQLLARDSKAKLAAIDPEGRDLKDYFSAGVYEPPSHDPEKVAPWLKAFFDAVLKDKSSGLVDTGGGDTAFGRVLAEMPDIVRDMDADGVAIVAAYLFSPRLSDLSPLATLRGAGFQPPATVLILNEGRVEAGHDPEQAFAQLRRHSVYRAALEAGAIELSMPKLPVAKKIEDRRLQYRHARDGIVPEGRTIVPLGWSDRSSVRSWLARMDAAMAPITSWIP